MDRWKQLPRTLAALTATVIVLAVSWAATYQKPKSPPQQALSAKEIYAKFRNSVVQLRVEPLPTKPDEKVKERVTCGFLFALDDIVLTSYRAIKDAARIDIRGRNGKKFTPQTITYDAKSDVALISLLERSDDTPIKPAPYKTVQTGETVFVLTGSSTILQSMVSGKKQIADAPCLALSADLNEAAFGGPVLNNRGQAVGVAIAPLTEGIPRNIASSTDTANSMLSNRKNWQSIANYYQEAKALVKPAAADEKPAYVFKSREGSRLSAELILESNQGKSDIEQVVVSEDGHYVLARAKNRLWVWDTESRSLVQEETFSSDISALALGAGNLLAFAFSDGTIQVRRLPNREIVYSMDVHDRVVEIQVAPGQDILYLLVSQSQKKEHALMALNLSDRSLTLIKDGFKQGRLIASPDGHSIATWSKTLINRANHEVIDLFDQHGNAKRIKEQRSNVSTADLGALNISCEPLIFLPDSKTLLTMTHTRKTRWLADELEMIDVESGLAKRSFNFLEQIIGVQITWSNDAVMISQAGRAGLFDLSSGEFLYWIEGAVGRSSSVSASRQVVAQSTGKGVMIWRIKAASNKR